MPTSRLCRSALRALGLTAAAALGFAIAIWVRTAVLPGAKVPPTATAPKAADHRLPLPRSAVAAESTAPGSIESGPTPGGRFLVVDWSTLAPVPAARATLRTEGTELDLEVEAGSFTLPPADVPQGRLRVEADGYFPLLGETRALPPEGGRLHLVPVEPVGVQCAASDTLEAIEGAQISVRSGSGEEASAATDAAGRASIDVGALGIQVASTEGESRPEYRVDLAAKAPGFLSGTARLEVRPGEPWGRVELLLDPARSFLLRAIDADSGDPIEGASVLHQWDYLGVSNVNKERRAARTDGAGEIVLSVREGARAIQILVAHPEHATTGLRLELDDLPEGDWGDRELVLALERGWTAEGYVLDEDGAPARNVMVDLDPVDRPDVSDWMRFIGLGALQQIPDMAATDAEGRFSIPRLQAGEYRVALVHKDCADDAGNPTLRVGPGAEDWVGILGRGLSATGRVVDERGAPIDEATLVLFRLEAAGKIDRGPGRQTKSVRTGKDGAFLAKGLLPARYRVQCSRGNGYRNRSETIDGAAPPVPWTIVLEARDLPPSAGEGTLWLRFSSEDDWLVQGNADVTLYRTEDLAPVASYDEQLQAGQLYWPGAPSGTFHAAVRIDGYAPIVLPLLEVASDPEESVKVTISPGLAASVALPESAASALLTVTELGHGLQVVRRIVPRAADRDGDLVVRLMPGTYTVRLEPKERGPILRTVCVSEGTVAAGSPLRIDLAGPEPSADRP